MTALINPMTDSKIMRFKKGRRAFRWGVNAAVLMITLYALLYLFTPFSQFTNDLLTNILNTGSAVICAVLATLVCRRYSEDEPLRGIWINLAAALWLWSLAEAVWAYYNMTAGEVDLTLADFFWFTGYVFFLIALFIQYHILFHPTPLQTRMVVVVTVFSLILIWLTSSWLLVRYTGLTLDHLTLIYIFYPTADLVIAFAALRLAHRFRSGVLSYPWLGLFVLAVADVMFAWLDLTGLYTWSTEHGNLLTTTADVIYFAAYLAIGLGYYAQWLLLQYGPILNLKRKV